MLLTKDKHSTVIILLHGVKKRGIAPLIEVDAPQVIALQQTILTHL